LRALRSPLQCGFVGLRIDPYCVQAAMSQRSGNRRQIHRLDESPRCVVSEPVRMDVSNIGSPAEHGQQIADTAVCVPSPFSTKDRTQRNWPHFRTDDGCSSQQCMPSKAVGAPRVSANRLEAAN